MTTRHNRSIRGALVDALPGRAGYGIYFTAIAAFGLFGAIAAWNLMRIAS